jgi:hypothetical protein
LSLQGESTFAGLPCIFIRLTACDLRCSYCDTAYAFTEGKKMKSLEEVIGEGSRAGRAFFKSEIRNPKFEIAPGRADRRRAVAPKKCPCR